MEGTHVGGVLLLVHLIHVRLVDVGRDGLRGHPIVLRLVHVHHVRGLGEAGGLAAVRDRRRGVGGRHTTLLLLLSLSLRNQPSQHPRRRTRSPIIKTHPSSRRPPRNLIQLFKRSPRNIIFRIPPNHPLCFSSGKEWILIR